MSSTRFCRRCGQELREGAQFCGECGATVEDGAPPTGPLPHPDPVIDEVEQPTRPIEPVAPTAGSVAAFDDHPRDDAGATAEFAAPPRGARGNRTRAAAWIAAIAVLVLVGGGIATWAALRDDDPGPTAAATTATAEDAATDADDTTAADTGELTAPAQDTTDIAPEPEPPAPTTVTVPPVTVTETETVTQAAPPADPPSIELDPAPVSLAEARRLTEEAFALNRSRRYAEAERLSRRALTALTGSGDPRETNAHYNLGLSLVRQGRCAEAIDPLQRSLVRGTDQQIRIRRDTLAEAQRCS